MNARTVHKRDLFRKLSAIAALLLSACAANVGDERELGTTQEPLNIVDGNGGYSGGRVYIGTDTAGNSYVYFRTGLSGSGTCVSVEQIGMGWTLFERTRVVASSNVDEVWELYGAETATPCAGQPQLRAFTGGKIEYYAGDGADYIYAPSSNPNRQSYGQGGLDHIFAGPSYTIDGGDGADKLIAETQTWGDASTTIMYGSIGTGDLMCHYGTVAIQLMDGGTGGAEWGWYSNVAPITVNNTQGHASQATCDTARAESTSPIGN